MVEIKLPCGNVAVVDDDDYSLVAPHSWRAAVCSRRKRISGVLAKGNGKPILIHRLILGVADGEIVDHKDRNPLNNTRGNLRICSQMQNMRNRGIARHNKCGLKGVYADERRRRWRAEIRVDRRRICLGSYATKELAAEAYDRAAIRYHGEFAVTNAHLREERQNSTT